MVIRRRGTSVTAWCRYCARAVPMSTDDEAAAAAGVTRSAMCSLAYTQALHSAEAPGGVLIICLESLQKYLLGERS